LQVKSRILVELEILLTSYLYHGNVQKETKMATALVVDSHTSVASDVETHSPKMTVLSIKTQMYIKRKRQLKNMTFALY
jgi:hypothetical protein